MVMRNLPKASNWKRDSEMSITTSSTPPARVMVKVVQGSIYGMKDRLPNGEPYFYFKGIPYAVPPTGKLRFRSPVPIEKYAVSYMDCTRERSACVGRDLITRNISGSEDGLFLNVYTPRVRTENEAPLPVMVFLHGGGMVGGSSDSNLYLPNYLVQEGVVVVTINYRLGVLGFLCLPNAGIEGNAGLKDQRVALQWVQQNIRTFCGDPSNVTLFGASSGGSNVMMHAFSEQSRQYFHKGITQSGAVFSDFLYQSQPEWRARKLAEHFGYRGSSDVEVLETLRCVSAIELFEAQFKILTPREQKLQKMYQLPFTAVIERAQSPDHVICKPPAEYLRDNGFMQMPIICGYNDKEGMFDLIELMKMLPEYNEQPENFIGRMFDVDYFSPEARSLGEEIKRHYLRDNPVSKNNLDELCDLLTDRYVLGLYAICTLWQRHQCQTSPLYVYRFAFDGLLNKGKALQQLQHLKGANHIDEVYYLFSSPLLKTEIPTTDAAFQMRQTMTRLWTNFAKYSEPTPSGQRFPFRWEPMTKLVDADNYTLLNIAHEIGMVPIPERKRLSKFLDIQQRTNGGDLRFVLSTIDSIRPY